MTVEIQPIITAIVFFVIGSVLGFIVRDRFFEEPIDLDNQSVVMIAVTLAWFISVMSDIAVPTYTTPIYVHGLAGGIVGFFFRPGKDQNDSE